MKTDKFMVILVLSIIAIISFVTIVPSYSQEIRYGKYDRTVYGNNLSNPFYYTGTMYITGTLYSTNIFAPTGTIGGYYLNLYSNGTAANPAIQNIYDSDTGIYWLATAGNRLGISAKGLYRVIIDTTGVAVRGKLEVRGGVTPLSDSLLVLRSSLGNTVMFVDSSGYMWNSGNIQATKNQNANTYIIATNNDSTNTDATANIKAMAQWGGISAIAHGKGRTSVRYGHAIGNWGTLETDATEASTGHNGLIIGTRSAKPILFGIDDTFAVGIDSLRRVGIGTEVPTGALTIRGIASNGDTLLNLQDSLGNTVASIDSTGKALFSLIDFPEIATPANPAANNIRLYAAEDDDFTVLQTITNLGKTFRINQDSYRIARNASGASIAAGKAVFFSGSTGNKPDFKLAQSDSEASMPAIGLTTATVANGNYGEIMIIGRLTGVKTDYAGWAEGDQLYVDPSTAGELTDVRPVHPNIAQWIGTIEVVHANAGVILINTLSITGVESGTNRNKYTIGDQQAGNKTLKFDGAADDSLVWDGTKLIIGRQELRGRVGGNDSLSVFRSSNGNTVAYVDTSGNAMFNSVKTAPFLWEVKSTDFYTYSLDSCTVVDYIDTTTTDAMQLFYKRITGNASPSWKNTIIIAVQIPSSITPDSLIFKFRANAATSDSCTVQAIVKNAAGTILKNSGQVAPTVVDTWEYKNWGGITSMTENQQCIYQFIIRTKYSTTVDISSMYFE